MRVRAEELGFDSIWAYDYYRRGTATQRLLECWTTLAALARETSRVQLGQIVTCAAYRNPGLLAQMASTVDAASGNARDRRRRCRGGRARVARLRVRRRAAADSRAAGAPRAHSAGAAHPPPGRPILVGGAGEKVLLRLVARYADACNLTDSFDLEYYRGKLDVLRRHCEDIGRDYDEIEKTASFTVKRDDDVDFEGIAATGIERFIIYLDPPADLDRLTEFAAQRHT